MLLYCDYCKILLLVWRISQMYPDTASIKFIILYSVVLMQISSDHKHFSPFWLRTVLKITLDMQSWITNWAKRSTVLGPQIQRGPQSPGFTACQLVLVICSSKVQHELRNHLWQFFWILLVTSVKWIFLIWRSQSFGAAHSIRTNSWFHHCTYTC